MTILCIGKTGQLAQSLHACAALQNIDLICKGRPDLDLNSDQTIEAALLDLAPDCVVNAAAYTAVDQAEDEPEAAKRLNTDAVAYLAESCARKGIPLIQISTDYVFDGAKAEPYFEDDVTDPQGIYGETKRVGELAIEKAGGPALILRTAWVYSWFGQNFVKTMLRLAQERDEVSVVDDQIGNPTSAHDLAHSILYLAQNWPVHDRKGVRLFHLAGSGHASWADVAEHVFAVSRSVGGPWASVKRVPSSEYPTRAKRPSNSRLDCEAIRRAYGQVLPNWQSSVSAVVLRVLGEKGRVQK